VFLYAIAIGSDETILCTEDGNARKNEKDLKRKGKIARRKDCEKEIKIKLFFVCLLGLAVDDFFRLRSLNFGKRVQPRQALSAEKKGTD